MGNADSNEDTHLKRDKQKPPPGKPEKYCPYSLYIPMRQTSYNNFQSNCSTMNWHWDKIAPYAKPLKKP
jgi:hypothetical protein